MKDKSIAEIKLILNDINDENSNVLNELKNDSRKGVQKLVAQKLKYFNKLKTKKHEFYQKFKYEHEFWSKGYQYVAGIDEVGRGPLAGPVVAGAVILSDDFDIYEVNDSKQMTDQKRHELAPLIKEKALAYSVSVIDSNVIDQVNIYEASRIAMKNAINQLDIIPNQLVIDAMDVDLSIPQLKLIKGDFKSVSIAAASILAKVYRDDLMIQYSKQYPEYGFDKNDGYGTKHHLNAIKQYGITEIHRKTFAPVKNSL
ncbi:ribonuclease HII [Lactobacillus sp. S2-2]|uniref:ribonuclease HII n=1 Tax=Lactobacillus sp. S2-2 TaxID=2692917 RepID=UPI001F024536|nr:ribonuclease HII [Lactobacillus sp. S2-2]MCF6515031.1 ribonuclease HII [Lactobacillus sp. S2-2]